ncbi:hypothetical protein [Rhizobium sp. NRK18]|uniref:hypothetical protein n=1 Tax=Rhizobium sp. NRK18 TaxID=2964667 RepID=UPI0021C35F9D|nr:hypothetical protein [Rhizobium sp. NRK18]MCQ2003525.1 hypothetical protein [Rhizobium sp. NRK18]
MASIEDVQGSGAAARSVIEKLRLMFGRSTPSATSGGRVDALDAPIRADIGIGDGAEPASLAGREQFWRAGSVLRLML